MQSIKKNTVYNVAIIGLGRIGIQMEMDEKRIKPATHFGSYYNNYRIGNIYLCDNDISKLEMAKSISDSLKTNKPTYYCTNYEELIDKNVDILVVATSPESHFDLVNFFAPYVKAIICEKPIAISVAEAKLMVEICENNKTLLVIDHSRRFLPLTWQCKEIIQNGIIGDVHQISAFYTAGIKNSGTHLLDLIRCLSGDIDKIDCAIESHYFCPLGDVNIDAMLTLKNGSRCVLQSLDSKDYAIFDINVYGSKGDLFISNFGFKAEIRIAEVCKTFGGYKELGESRLVADNSNVSMWENLAIHVINSLDNNIVLSDKSSGVDGVKTLEIITELIKVKNK